jgi:C-terminal processing protease CtpA/Prc
VLKKRASISRRLHNKLQIFSFISSPGSKLNRDSEGEAEKMEQRRCGQVGIACKQHPKGLGLLITGFIVGSDASTSELRVGDVIVQVEENFLPGLPASEAFELMNGRMLAPVELTVARQVKDVKKTMFRGQQTFVTEIIRDVPVPPTKASVGFDFKIEAQGLRVVTVHDKTRHAI